MRNYSGKPKNDVDRRLRAAIGLLAVSVIAACSDSTGIRANGSSQLAFAVSGASASASTASAAVVPVTRNGDTLDLTQVSITVDRAKLKRQRTDVCDDEDNSGPGKASSSTSGGICADVRVGPATVDLPLSGDPVSVPANALPAGTFREIELRLSQFRFKGTFNGQAFDVTVPVHVNTEIEFETPLVVADSVATSITVFVPVGDWFVNLDGSLVDPGKILTTPALLAQIQARIAGSLRVFEDRDHDGRDDHGHDDHHGNHGPGN